MKDKELKLDETRASHTLGRTGEGFVFMITDKARANGNT
jgi:hypothetical protein